LLSIYLDAKKGIVKKLTVFVLAILLLTCPTKTSAYSTNMSASVVLGQPDFTSNTLYGGASGPNDKSFIYPWGICVHDGKLIVSDRNLNRILIWNSIPTQNNTPADVVLGQPDFTTGTANNGGVTAQSLSESIGLSCTNGKILIADELNHRVLIWNSIPTVNNTPADIVIGQPNMISNSENAGINIGPNTLRKPRSVWYDGTKLIVSDSDNHRILIFNSLPTTNGASADIVVGQPDFTSTGREVSQRGLNRPFGVYSDGTKLYVGDFMAHRVMIWNQIPTQNHQPADVVIGQPDFISDLPNQGGQVGPNTIAGNPFGIFKDTFGRLFVADRGSNRILIFNSIPTSNNASADLVIGQPSFTSSSINQSGKDYFQGGSVECCADDNTLYGPRYLYAYQDKLFVADVDNHRVLIFDNKADTSINGLTSYWNLDSVNASGVSSVEGIFGNAAKLNGINSYISAYPDKSNRNNLTLTGWVNFDSPNNLNQVDDYHNLFGWDWEFRLNFRTYTQEPGPGYFLWLQGTTMEGPTHNISALYKLPQKLTGWHHLAATFDGSSAKIYLDGVNVKTQQISGSGIRDNGRFFHIGGEDEFHQYFDGTIDEVRIYSRALMDPEILTLYNNH